MQQEHVSETKIQAPSENGGQMGFYHFYTSIRIASPREIVRLRTRLSAAIVQDAVQLACATLPGRAESQQA